MARPYSLDLRERVLKDCDNGMSKEDTARKYSVSITWVYSLWNQRRDTGCIAPKKYKRGPKMKLAPYEKEVRQAIADYPDATLVELAEILSQYVPVSDSTVCDFLKHLKITRKKRLSALPSDTVKMSSPSEKNGRHSKRQLTLKNSFSSTKPGPKRT